MNTAIIVAAGSGTRFGGETPKQFIELLGKPLIVHTLERFEDCPAIDQTVLVVAADKVKDFSAIAEKHKFKKLVKIVSGGKTRAESVLNGLLAVDPETARIIAVHDGARPLVSAEEINAVVEQARETGAACLVGKVTDTIKEVSAGRIVRTIDRNKLRRAQTPQCFRYEILKRAFDGADLSEAVTDECFLVEKIGLPIALVEGSPKNIKVTTPADLVLAAIFLEQN